MLDFNHGAAREKQANERFNELVDQGISSAAPEAGRTYLGASALGHDCLRKVQWDWTRQARHAPRTERIFARGRWWEDYAHALMARAGFHIVRHDTRITFSQLGGAFRGHGDGLVTAGPELAGAGYPCLWENKGIGSKGWAKLAKEGLRKAYPAYFVQVQLYMAYFGLTEWPALFTAWNSDTCEVLALLVAFDPVTAQEWSDKAVTVVRAQQANDTLPRVAESADDWRCKLCSHKEACWS